MDKPVSFELAKLLKEKEYKDKNVLGTVRLSEPKYYDSNGIIHDIKNAFDENDYKIEDCFNAPTIAKVVMWLYEKHGVWCHVMRHKDHAADVNDPYEFTWDMGRTTHKTPTKAYEAAIEYALKNLVP